MTIVTRVRMPRDEKGNDPNDHRDDPEFVNKLNGKRPPDLDWVSGFVLTDEEVSELTDPVWVYVDLIIQGHLAAIPAEPGAGKTTIVMYVAGEIAPDYAVYYVNADVGSGDVKSMQEYASRKGFDLLLPDMKAGLSTNDVVTQLERMNGGDADYRGTVFIFDTLKKMTDVINKTRAKELYKTLRGLTAKGMTIILLCHTNKYTDVDGNPIYEGTGDLRSDVDELVYLIPKKQDDGGLIVSTQPDKARGRFRPITFRITPDREVSRLDDFIDVVAMRRAERQREEDSTVIEAITAAIRAGNDRQTGIVDYCRNTHDIGRRTVEAVLRRYVGNGNRLWKRQKALEKNAWKYELAR
jgi:hypothetical protein